MVMDLVHAYNHSEHVAHGMRPVDVKQNNSLSVFNKLYGEMLVKRKPRFKVGDHVRIDKDKLKFEKGYEYRFQEEIYEIYDVIPHNVPVYLVKDALGRKVEGKFYENELSLVRGVDEKEYKTEQVSRGREEVH